MTAEMNNGPLRQLLRRQGTSQPSRPPVGTAYILRRCPLPTVLGCGRAAQNCFQKTPHLGVTQKTFFNQPPQQGTL